MNLIRKYKKLLRDKDTKNPNELKLEILQLFDLGLVYKDIDNINISFLEDGIKIINMESNKVYEIHITNNQIHIDHIFDNYVLTKWLPNPTYNLPESSSIEITKDDIKYVCLQSDCDVIFQVYRFDENNLYPLYDKEYYFDSSLETYSTFESSKGHAVLGVYAEDNKILRYEQSFNDSEGILSLATSGDMCGNDTLITLSELKDDIFPVYILENVETNLPILSLFKSITGAKSPYEYQVNIVRFDTEIRIQIAYQGEVVMDEVLFSNQSDFFSYEEICCIADEIFKLDIPCTQEIVDNLKVSYGNWWKMKNRDVLIQNKFVEHIKSQFPFERLGFELFYNIDEYERFIRSIQQESQTTNNISLKKAID